MVATVQHSHGVKHNETRACSAAQQAEQAAAAWFSRAHGAADAAGEVEGVAQHELVRDLLEHDSRRDAAEVAALHLGARGQLSPFELFLGTRGDIS